MPYVVGRERTTLVTLTERGRDVLEERRRPGRRTAIGRPFYAGIAKPRELAHDARVHSAYVRAAERLCRAGRRVRRVRPRGGAEARVPAVPASARIGRRRSEVRRPQRDAAEDRPMGQEHQLPWDDGHVQFPDARLEYDDRDGRRDVEDIEVVTPHYRGAHAAAKVRAGFTRYRAVGAASEGFGTWAQRSWRQSAAGRGAAAMTRAEQIQGRRGLGLHGSSGAAFS